MGGCVSPPTLQHLKHTPDSLPAAASSASTNFSCCSSRILAWGADQLRVTSAFLWYSCTACMQPGNVVPSASSTLSFDVAFYGSCGYMDGEGVYMKGGNVAYGPSPCFSLQLRRDKLSLPHWDDRPTTKQIQNKERYACQQLPVRNQPVMSATALPGHLWSPAPAGLPRTAGLQNDNSQDHVHYRELKGVWPCMCGV